MSIQSINHSLIPLIPQETIDKFNKSYQQELQQACEQADLKALHDMYTQFPYHDIYLNFNLNIAKVLVRDAIKNMLDTESYAKILKDYTDAQINQIDFLTQEDQEFLISIVNRLKINQDVSDEELRKVSENFAAAEILAADNRMKDIKVFPLIIALSLNDFDLAKLMVRGVNLKDEMFLENLKFIHINSQYDQIISFLKENGLDQSYLEEIDS